jgi:hypothetical protein
MWPFQYILGMLRLQINFFFFFFKFLPDVAQQVNDILPVMLQNFFKKICL